MKRFPHHGGDGIMALLVRLAACAPFRTAGQLCCIQRKTITTFSAGTTPSGDASMIAQAAASLTGITDDISVAMMKII